MLCVLVGFFVFLFVFVCFCLCFCVCVVVCLFLCVFCVLCVFFGSTTLKQGDESRRSSQSAIKICRHSAKRSSKSGAHPLAPPRRCNVDGNQRTRERAGARYLEHPRARQSGTGPSLLPSFPRTDGPHRSIFLPSRNQPQRGDICPTATAQNTSFPSLPALVNTRRHRQGLP